MPRWASNSRRDILRRTIDILSGTIYRNVQCYDSHSADKKSNRPAKLREETNNRRRTRKSSVGIAFCSGQERSGYSGVWEG